MKAVLIDEFGGPEQLRIGEHPKPVPGENELLVRVHATALNRADLLQRQGKYPPPEGTSEVLGLEMGGTVEAKGAACPNWNLGDRVFGLLPGGGYAEYAVIHRDMAMAVPPRLSFEEAAAVPEVFLTAFQALYWFGEVDRSKRVLIHAGASGVGTAAIQLAKVEGAHPYITASAPKHELCRQLGAEATIDYRSEDFAERILDVTDGTGVDIIVDFVGAPYFENNLKSLAVDGRMILLATLGGAKVHDLNLRTLFQKRAHIVASTLRNRDLAYKIDLTRDFAAYMLPLFEDGKLKPVIDSIYDWTDVQAAHRRMENNENAGKIVLRLV